MKKFLSLILTIVMLVGIIPALPLAVSAETDGPFTYEVSGGEATITDFDASYEGELTIPSTLGGYPVTAIADYAFYNCDALTSVTMPDSVVTIGNYAFYASDSLTSVTISENAVSIGFRAFEKCDGLSTITIPDSVTSIGEYAFFSTELTSITLGSGLTSIGDFAFRFCDQLESFHVSEESSTFSSVDGVLFNKDQTALIKYPAGKEGSSYVIPDSVISIGSYAFEDCRDLTSITIPEGVLSIGEYAFSGCSGLTSLDIPDSVTTIGTHAFSNLTLTSISLGSSLTNLADEAVFYCDSLTSFTVSEDNTTFTTIDGVLFSKDETTLVRYPTGKEGSYTVPAGTTTIGDYAFADSERLSGITILSPVTTIGDYAFRGCSGLGSINIPDGVTSIGEGAFNFCTSLCLVIIPESVTSIGASAFSGCQLLDTVNIPEGITAIENNTFEDCSFLTSITLPSTVTTIGDYAFAGCWNLASINLTTAITSIGEGAFLSCYNLTSVTLPNSITVIPDWLFWDCSQLTSVTIPYGVTSIGDSAFAWTSLTSIDIPASVTSIGENAFELCGLTTIAIPDGIQSISNETFYGCFDLDSISIPSSVTTIGYDAFLGCSNLTDVYFNHNDVVWARIDIKSGNDDLLNATLHPLISIPTEPPVTEDPDTIPSDEITTAIDEASNVIVVTEVSIAIFDGKSGYYVTGIQAGEEVELLICDEIEEYNGVDVTTLTKGDVIMVATGIEYVTNLVVKVDAETIAAAQNFSDYRGEEDAVEELIRQVASKNGNKLTFTEEFASEYGVDGKSTTLSLGGKSADFTLVSKVAARTTVIASTYSAINPIRYDYVLYIRTVGDNVIDVVIYEYAKGGSPLVEATEAPATEVPTEESTTVPTEEPTTVPTTAPTEEPTGELTVSKSSVSVKVGKSVSVSAYLGDVDITSLATWNSKKDSVATVENGTITGEKAGYTSVSVSYGDQIKQIEVEVKASGGSSSGGGGGGIVKPSAAPTAAPTQAPIEGTTPFRDVSERDWFYDAVSYAYETGLMNGISETEFSPQSTITRAMFVTVLYRMEGEPEVTGALPFTDVPAGSYYEKAVLWALQEGIVTGTSETTFAPDAEITREQMAAMIYRYAQLYGASSDGTFALDFADSDDVSDYAREALAWCTMKGIIQGMDGNMLCPKENATRAQAATIFMRLENAL